jgi:hypothetical protein
LRWSDAALALGFRRHRKIEMMVQVAVGVEGRAAVRTSVGHVQVIANRHFAATGATKDGLLMPRAFRPGRKRMIGKRIMAILARVVEPAAFHPDRYDIAGRMPVRAACLGIEVEAVDAHTIRIHG